MHATVVVDHALTLCAVLTEDLLRPRHHLRGHHLVIVTVCVRGRLLRIEVVGLMRVLRQERRDMKVSLRRMLIVVGTAGVAGGTLVRCGEHHWVGLGHLLN